MPITGFQSLCEERASIIVSKDKKESRRHVANNRDSSKVYHYRVDGNIINEGNKCDFLLINEDARVAYLIELKGSDLAWAAKQIDATLQRLKAELQPYSLRYRIVASKCKTQEIESTEFRKYRIKWKNQLVYKTECLEERI